MRRIALPLLAALAAAAPLHAQSLFSSRGLGTPVAPVDARARALGGIRTGLLGFDLSMGNPADAAGVVLKGALATMQPASQTIDFQGQKATTNSTRFPLVQAIYPFSGGRTVATFGYGAFLDQSWGLQQPGTEVFAGDTVRVEDLIRSTGGVSEVRLGVAYSITPRLSVGGAAGLYIGDLARDVRRSFPDSASQNFQGFSSRTQWGYKAPLVSAGFRWDPVPIVRLAGAATWSGKLKAKADSAGAGLDRTYTLPLQLTGGISALLAPQLTAAFGATYAGWSKTSADFLGTGLVDVTPGTTVAATTSRNTLELGGGLEYTGLGSGSRAFPIRFGYHRAQLPFAAAGEPAGSEWSASAGIGYRFAVQNASPIAVADAAIERGKRTGGDLNESFWRFTVSLALFGR